MAAQKKKITKITIDDIKDEFINPQPIYLNERLAIAYILASILKQVRAAGGLLAKGRVYGTQLTEDLAAPKRLRVSDTVLYAALDWLKAEGAVQYRHEKIGDQSRGRPRCYYWLTEEWRDRAEELAILWEEYSRSR